MAGRCLQETLGSCGGCNVLEIARNAARGKNIAPAAAAADIQRQYCPTGLQMQTHLLEPGATTSYGAVVYQHDQ